MNDDGLPDFDALARLPADSAEDADAASGIGRAIIWLIKNPNVIRDVLLTLREVGLLPNPAAQKAAGAQKAPRRYGSTYDERKRAELARLAAEARELEVPIDLLIDDELDGLESDSYLIDQLSAEPEPPPPPRGMMEDIIRAAGRLVAESPSPPAAAAAKGTSEPPRQSSLFAEFAAAALERREGAAIIQSDVFKAFRAFCAERGADHGTSFRMRTALEALGYEFVKRRDRYHLINHILVSADPKKKSEDGPATVEQGVLSDFGSADDPPVQPRRRLSRIELGFLAYLLRYFDPAALADMAAKGRSVVKANKRAVCAGINAIKFKAGLDGLRSVTPEYLRSVMKRIDREKYDAICAVEGGWEFIESEWAHILEFCDEEEGKPAGPGSRLVQGMLMRLIKR